jgi:carbonic anhydrase
LDSAGRFGEYEGENPMKKLCCTILAIFAAAIYLNAKDAQSPTSATVLAVLKAGNQRHVSAHYSHPHETAAYRQELSAGQHPQASILTCADSRVAPEIIFDQGLGDLFDVRVAGNVAGDDEIASLEYAAEHLHTPVIVVMGHQKCGAVSAAVEGGEAAGHLSSIITPISAAVSKAKKLQGDLVENSVRINVENVVEELRTSKPVLSELVSQGKLTIVGAVYSLDTGKVTWLSESTSQTAKN